MSWKPIVALVILVAGLGAAFFALAKPESTTTTGPPRTGEPLFPRDENRDVVKLELTRTAPDALRLVAERDTTDLNRWLVKLESAGRTVQDVADRQNVERIVNETLQLRSHRHLTTAEAQGNLAAYGLEAPSVRIAMNLRDGTSRQVALGGPSPQEGRIYAAIEGREGVHIVSRTPRDASGHPADDYRDHVVMPIEPFNASVLEVTMPAGIVSCRREADTWWQTAPVRDRADTRVVHEFLTVLHQQARAKDFIETPTGGPEALKPYGLDAPFLAVAVTGGNATDVVRVSYGEGPAVVSGSPVRSVYARRHDTGRIYHLGPDNLPKLQKDDPHYFRTTDLLAPAGADVTRLVVTDPGRPAWELRRDGLAWRIAAPARRDCDTFKIDNLVKRLDEWRAVAYLDALTAESAAAAGLGPDRATKVEIYVKDALTPHAMFLVAPADAAAGDRVAVRAGADGAGYAVPKAVADSLLGRGRPAGRGYLGYQARAMLDGFGSVDVTAVTLEVRAPDGTRKTGTWKPVAAAGAPRVWACADAAWAAVPSVDIEGLIADLVALQVARWLDEDPADLAAYGLVGTPDAPGGCSARVILDSGAGATAQTRTLFVGALTPDGWPVRAEGGDPSRAKLIGIVDKGRGERWRGILLQPGVRLSGGPPGGAPPDGGKPPDDGHGHEGHEHHGGEHPHGDPDPPK